MQYESRRFGQFYLIKLIGHGGFADVYEAYDCYLRRRVAIKVLHTRLTPDKQRAFLREARTLARLNHPHIIKVLQYNVHGNIPYIVMNLATNGTLGQLHPLGEQLPLDTIITYLWEIADALTYIHKLSLVHQDIKPENLLLGENGEILLNDFGIATFIQNAHSRANRTCTGTVYYMAPERFEGMSSPASDQYALAVLVYSWLTGIYPFNGSSQEVIWQHIYATPPSLRTIRPDIPLAIEQVVLQTMAKDPQDRFESVWEFVATLDAARYVTSPPDLSSSSSFIEFLRSGMRFILGSRNF
jgi:eukaryotic-like serine/threonine-protein kinase